MKFLPKFLALVVCTVLAITTFSSCEWDSSPNPDHPTYVSYAISAADTSFVGPDQLLVDIESWITANQKLYDVEVNYSTGAASEFAKTDSVAIKHYETFAPKFKAYLQEVYNKLNDGTYGADAQVEAYFHVFAKRTQGQGGDLKYELVKFTYPSATAE